MADAKALKEAAIKKNAIPDRSLWENPSIEAVDRVGRRAAAASTLLKTRRILDFFQQLAADGANQAFQS